MNDPLKFATHLAIQAGNLLKQYYSPAGLHSSPKADHTLVTEADLAADRMITTSIHARFPSDEIISEESSHQVKDIHSLVWVIDPLDGTTNFSLGLPIWGVSIARLVDGSPELGVAYFPLLNELYTARRGNVAALNDKSISTRAPDPRQPNSFFACCSRTFRNYSVDIPYRPRILGSAVYSLCMVARGVALLGLDATPKIWDLAAAWLLVEQAGGKVSSFEGPPPFPIAPAVDYRAIQFPTLAAATEQLFRLGEKKVQRKSKFAMVIQDKS